MKKDQFGIWCECEGENGHWLKERFDTLTEAQNFADDLYEVTKHSGAHILSFEAKEINTAP